ncbi:hypothetical protein M8J76_006582 [Diaphorina citri]|nr:hypothetical protein M8J76_006582 [Diaphorina citri]
MAKVTKKDGDAYFKEKESFLRDLQHFHETRGTPCRHVPKIGGKEIDLYLLYCLVTSNGGWVKVNSRNQWNSLLKEFHLPKHCVNVSVALKQIYLRYLDKYEKAHFLGETHNAIEDDEDTGGGRHKRWSNVRNAQPTVPLAYNHSQHQITDSVRASSSLCKTLYTPSEYDKLALSLLCPLPNEQDFALNVCTLLSNEFRAAHGQPTGIRLNRHTRLLRYLLAHAGSLEAFWDDVVEDRKILAMMREMIEEDSRVIDESTHILRIRQREREKRRREGKTDAENPSGEIPSEVLSDEDEASSEAGGKFRVSLRLRPEDKSLFALGRALGTREGVGQRVLQIATVLRNFTFNEENNALLSRDLTFLRFMILCCSSNWNCLRQLGLDMFSNVASEITMDETLAPVLFDIISTGLGSEDRAYVLSCIEILNKLGQVERNEDILLRSLQQKIYNQVCTLLTLHDIMLLIHTLECVYSLSSLGERACNAIMRVHGAIDVLVSLVTVEAQSFGPKACILMRVVETVGPASNDPCDSPNDPPSSSSFTSLTSVPPSQPTGLNAPTFTLPMALAPVAVAVPVPLSQAQPPASPTPSVTAPMAPMARQRPPGPGQNSPRPSSPAVSSPAPVITSTSSVVGGFQQRNTYRVVTPNKVIVSSSSGVAGSPSPSPGPASGSRPPEENGEMFATQWLRANFEHASLPGRAIEQAELYKQYINAASRAGRKGVIAPLHFPRVVRSVFGAQIGPKQVIPAAPPGSTAPPPPPIHVYEGIQVRGKQPIITQTIAIAPSHHQTAQLGPSQSGPSPRAPSPSPLQNPMSPILKAQLSAPPKPQTSASQPIASSSSPSPLVATPGCSTTPRTKAHPHLSQALLGAGSSSPGTPPSSSTAPVTTTPGSTSADPSASTSLIKSLLANKVGPDPTSGSTASVVVSSSVQQCAPLVVNTAVASQVTQRQQQAQKMLSQSTSTGTPGSSAPTSNVSCISSTGNISKAPGQQQMRLNGVTINMQQVTNHIIENSLDPKQQPSSAPGGGSNELSSSSIGVNTSQSPSEPSQPPPLAPLSGPNSTRVGDSETVSPIQETGTTLSTMLVDGTSVVVNGGMSNSINPATDTSDLSYKENIAKQSLMLVDLLEKSISDKDLPTMNGAIRIGEKGLDLFTSIDSKQKLAGAQQQQQQGGASFHPPTSTSGVIRRVSTELESVAAHKPNGTPLLVKQNGADLKRPRLQSAEDASEQPAVKKVHVNGDVNPASVPGTTGEEEADENNVKASSTAANLYAALAADVLEDEELVEATPPTLPPNPASAGQPIIQPAQTVLNPAQTILNPAGSSQGSTPGQNIIVTGGGTGGPRQILVTGTPGGVLPQRLSMGGQHYVVTQQPQLVQGHSGQTVLVAQAAGGQQGGPGSKTIIILQPSSSSSSSPLTSTSKTIASIASTTITTNTNQKVIVSVPPPGTPQTSVVHRTPIRPQTAGGMSTPSIPNSATTVIKQVPDTRPMRPALQPSGFQQQFLQQQKLVQQQQQQTPPQQKLIQQQTPGQQQPQQPPTGQFICEWRGCMRNFKSANEVYMHACENHCPVTPTAEIQCLWERCDVMRRKRFSHMTHLYDRHCNPDVLKMMAVRRKQLSLSGKTEIPPPPAPTPHPGYAPNAAFNAIKRHALEFVNPKELQQRVAKAQEPAPRPFEQDDNEGPVTKSIRLTSSLILRNLVIYSTTGRRHLVSYEPHLASVALSNVESSKTIAQVLFDMNDTQSR